MSTGFSEFVRLCKRIELTSSINEKVSLISSFLSKLDKSEWNPFLMLISGKAVPESIEGGLGIGMSAVQKALTLNIKPLLPSSPPTIREVYSMLLKISRIRGERSQERRVETLSSLFSRVSEEEKIWITKIIFGELRIGVEEGLILYALAKATGLSADKIRRIYMLKGELNDVVNIILGDRHDFDNVLPIVFRPLKPMLATPASSIKEAFNMVGGGEVAVEIKYDGARLQVHIKDGALKFFSRRLTDVTRSLPDIEKIVKENISQHVMDTIMEGEVIAIDIRGKPVPFQYLMRRFRRIKDIDDIINKIPARIYLFDILYLNGRLLIDLPYKERYDYLKDTVPKEFLADRIVTDNINTAEKFFRKALLNGHEGVMIKNLNEPYILGMRGKYWIKVKSSEHLDLVIIGAEWGHGRRRRWLSDYYLAVYNSEKGRYEIVGKTFKGLTDEEFQYITDKLLSIIVKDEGYRIWVKPNIVVEVAFNEIQKSPKYRSGLALRLARIIRIREDKSPNEVTTLSELMKLYERQFRFKGRI